MNFIGLDIGTTSICGIVMEAEKGKILNSVTRSNNTSLESVHTWEFIQDPGAILKMVFDIFEELTSDCVEIDGIGITGQMHGILYVNEAGNYVSPLYTWQDQRGNLSVNGSGGETYVDRLSRITAMPLATGFGLVTHDYNRQNGLIPANASYICTIADYAAMKLTGGHTPYMDPTNAASLGLFNMKLLDFEDHTLEAAEIDRRMLPEVVLSGTLIGHSQTGIPVTVSLGDNQASFLGSVREVADSVLLNVGTGSQISVFSERYYQIESLDIRPFPGGGYLLVGASLSGGKSYALLESFFREVCIQLGGLEDPGRLYDRMSQLAESTVLDGKLQVHTQFFGSRTDPDRKGSIEGMDSLNFTPSHLIIGVIDGIIAELHQFYDAFPCECQQQIKSLVGSGNGIRNNSTLCSRLCNVFNLPLQISAHPEEAAYGASLCAAVGCAVFPDFRQISFR
ncbi:sedoheptulokinase [Paenibacillus sp. 1_12]|uniref:sedoheptulokinase n=1 Tax=Paenibacillus sp. 1_12 TaxID=1566278 RepID=UPI0008E187F8|nr:FGGY family carbohydrate kinase [Paenibacillus sp. 1_12]SFL56535.1 sedoheptulokinase [Paenibacillus sp. 1_12]